MGCITEIDVVDTIGAVQLSGVAKPTSVVSTTSTVIASLLASKYVICAQTLQLADCGYPHVDNRYSATNRCTLRNLVIIDADTTIGTGPGDTTLGTFLEFIPLSQPEFVGLSSSQFQTLME